MTETLRQQVIAAERAFAGAFAARDFDTFMALVSEEAVFMDPQPLHGKQAVAAQWKPYFDAPTAPFSWEPQRVEVLESGALAISNGPVFGANGQVAATYNSVWRQEEPGQWRVIFDIGGAAPVQR